MGNEKQIGKGRRYSDDEDSTDIKQSWCFNMTSSGSTQRTPCKRKSSKGECSTNVRFDDIEQNVERQNDEVEPVKRKLPRKTKGFNVTSKIRKTFTMCCTPGRDSSVENDDKIRDEENIRERNSDDAYSNLKKKYSPHSSKNKGPESNGNSSDWSVSSPIVRPKTLSKSCTKAVSANQMQNRQIKSIYKPSVRKSSNVPLTKETRTAKLPVNGDASGETEVKHSKAQHDFDLIEDKGASRPAVIRERIIKHARRRTRSFAKQENEPVLVTVEPDTLTTKNDNTPKSGSQLTNATDDVKVDVPKAGEVQPVYIETEATVDYGRCVVEPSYGEKPDRKKLRTGKREKVKTKGQANKHLMAKKENRDFETMIDEYLAEIDDYEEVDDKVEIVAEKEETENATTPSPAVMNAVDQPQVLDDREFHLVPDEIKRVDDPFLEDVEELYKVSTPGSNKKEKRKQKADRKKENRSRKSGQTVLKLA